MSLLSEVWNIRNTSDMDPKITQFLDLTGHSLSTFIVNTCNTNRMFIHVNPMDLFENFTLKKNYENYLLRTINSTENKTGVSCRTLSQSEKQSFGFSTNFAVQYFVLTNTRTKQHKFFLLQAHNEILKEIKFS